MRGSPKRIARIPLFTMLALVVAACGSESNGSPGSSGTTTGGTASGSCYAGNDCAAGQYCFVEGDPKGTCKPLPPSCRATDCKCLSDQACGDAGSSMCAVQGRATVGCARTATANLRKQNDACSPFVACADGLMCFVASSLPGTCQPTPSACEPDDKCDCIERETASACPAGKTPSCSGIFAIAHYIDVACK